MVVVHIGDAKVGMGGGEVVIVDDVLLVEHLTTNELLEKDILWLVTWC